MWLDLLADIVVQHHRRLELLHAQASQGHARRRNRTTSSVA
jgi:hypothetical protein